MDFKKIKIARVVLLPIVFTSLASGAVIYSENANGLTAGTSTLADSSNWGGPAADYGVVAGGSLFATNHFELTAPDGNFNFANRDEGSRDLLSFSFDVVDLGTSTSGDASVRLAFRHDGGGSTFLDVSAATIADNTIIHYDYIANNTGSAVLFEDGVTSIAANTAELWADGIMVGTKSTANANNFIGIGIWNRRPDNAFLFDNLELRDTAYLAPSAIPEPTSLGLAVLGIIGFARRRRS